VDETHVPERRPEDSATVEAKAFPGVGEEDREEDPVSRFVEREILIMKPGEQKLLLFVGSAMLLLIFVDMLIPSAAVRAYAGTLFRWVFDLGAAVLVYVAVFRGVPNLWRKGWRERAVALVVLLVAVGGIVVLLSDLAALFRG